MLEFVQRTVALAGELHCATANDPRADRILSELRDMRLGLTTWAMSSEIAEPADIQAALLATQALAQFTSLLHLPPTEAEWEIMARLRGDLPAGWGNWETPKKLIAAFSYFLPHELPPPGNLDQAPDWFLGLAPALLMRWPLMFDLPGQARACYDWTEALFNALVKTKDVKRAESFLDEASLTYLMAADQSFDKIGRDWGRLVERCLCDRDLSGFMAPPARSKPLIVVLGNRINSGGFSILAPLLEEFSSDEAELVFFTLEAPGPGVAAFLEKRRARHIHTKDWSLDRWVTEVRALAADGAIIMSNIVSKRFILTDVAAHRLAPKQVMTFTSPWTSGLQSIDGLIFGSLNMSSHTAGDFTEDLIEVPDHHTFCNDLSHAREDAPTEHGHSPLERRDGDFLLVNNAPIIKITDETLSAWTDILVRVPQARLVLLPFRWIDGFGLARSVFHRRLREKLDERGLERDRVTLLEPLPTRDDLIATLSHCDVFLDSFPFGAGSSILDPFDSGLPMVAHRNALPSVNLGAVVLETAGLGRLIAEDQSAYVDLAVDLATDGGKYAALKASVVEAHEKDAFMKIDTFRVAAHKALSQALFTPQSHVRATGSGPNGQQWFCDPREPCD